MKSFWLWLKALLVWAFAAAILLIWNQGFLLFYPDTWSGYRNRHYDRLTFSLLVLAGVSYGAVWMARKGLGKKATG